MDSQKQMINEVSQVITRAQAGFSGRRFHWPRAVRERIGLLIKSGMTIDEVAEAVPIPRATLFRWAWGNPSGVGKRNIHKHPALPGEFLSAF